MAKRVNAEEFEAEVLTEAKERWELPICPASSFVFNFLFAGNKSMKYSCCLLVRNRLLHEVQPSFWAISAPSSIVIMAGWCRL